MMTKLKLVLKWFKTNLLLPGIPILVRMFVRACSKDDVPLWSLDDLLYYNFFICLLVIEGIAGRKDVFSGIIRLILISFCGLDLLLIALSLTDAANEFALVFSIAAAMICASIGIIYEIADVFMGRREGGL